MIGYLALASRVGVLPVYLVGTHEAMPKGSNIIKNREVGARIGRFLPIEELEGYDQGIGQGRSFTDSLLLE